MKHPEHYCHTAGREDKHLDETEEGSRAVLTIGGEEEEEDGTRENWSPLYTVNIPGVTNLNQFSTVQYYSTVLICSAQYSARIIITFKPRTSNRRYKT